jgi:hypothetical protein
VKARGATDDHFGESINLGRASRSERESVEVHA